MTQCNFLQDLNLYSRNILVGIVWL